MPLGKPRQDAKFKELSRGHLFNTAFTGSRLTDEPVRSILLKNKKFITKLASHISYKLRNTAQYLSIDFSPCSERAKTAASNVLVLVDQERSISTRLWLHFLLIRSRPESFTRVTQHPLNKNYTIYIIYI